MKYKLFVDLDSVLTDFLGDFKRTTGVDIRDVEDGFTKYIEGNRSFWSHMKWMGDGKELWNYVKKFNPTILSKPTGDPASRAGKKEWVMRELGKNVPVILDFQKYRYAKQNYILVDDQENNTVAWEEHGGIAILHKDAKSTIMMLKGYFGG